MAPTLSIRSPRSHRYGFAEGLAVSGGVDSMALAVLCRQLEIQDPEQVSFKAFIADHGLRRESAEEAQKVAWNLENLGLCTRILKLNWALAVKPDRLSNFEAQARQLRYRALGQACAQWQAHDLLVAHHDDDQAETILLRLISGYTGRGLSGMKQVARIPECSGLFGVHESVNSNFSVSATSIGGFVEPMSSSSPGIMIYRPLLKVAKERLRATCAYFNVEHFEDATNYDKTLTLRNVLRYLLQERRLPSAINKKSLLHLSQSITAKVNPRHVFADEVFQRCLIHRFDKRSGLVIIQFPRNIWPAKYPSQGKQKQQVLEATLLLEKVVRLVTPFEEVSLHQLVSAAEQVFPSSWIERPTNDVKNSLSTFTAAGIQWCRMLDLPDCWTLSREPHHSGKPIPRCPFPISPLEDGIDPEDSLAYKLPQWQLFDGRFWIRCIHRGRVELAVRPFRESDIKQFRNEIDQSKLMDFERAIAESAPGKLRWTLPAIVAARSNLVLALPTLGFSARAMEALLEWQVRYRKVDLPSEPSRD